MILVNSEAKWIKRRNTLTPNFSFEGIKRSVLNVATTFCKIFYQNDKFMNKLLKISLLQSAEVLWIHNIDAICMLK